MSLKSPKLSRASVSGRSQRNFGIAAKHRDRDDEEEVIREEVEEGEAEEGDAASRFLSLDAIRTDGGTQSRAGLNAATVQDYAEAMQAGKRFPALTVFYDGSAYHLADGFHRYEAARRAGIDLFECDVRQGTQRDAILHSVGANGNHGLPRTAEDKRRAVSKLLFDPEWTQWSNRQIAEQCDVSPGLVDKLRLDLRDQLPTVGSERKYLRDGQELAMQTGNIGKGRVTYGPQEDGHPDEPSIDVDAVEASDQPVELQAGMTVRQIHTGQIGKVSYLNGAQVFVETRNGMRIYDRQNLELIEEPSLTPGADDPYERASAMADEANRTKTHWANGGEVGAFWQKASYYGFGEDVLEAIQPGATALTDLNLTHDECHARLNQIAQARTRDLFPNGSIVKTRNGDFGKVVDAQSMTVDVTHLEGGHKRPYRYQDLTLSSMEEYEQTPKKHWADERGADFETTVRELGFEMAGALELLQPGAKEIRDLTMDYWDARRRLSDIVRKQLTERFPVDSLIKTPEGHFGQITSVYSTGVHIADYLTGYRSLDFDKIALSSQAELDAALAAVQPSGFERFDDYQAEMIRDMLPALRRVLDFAEGKGVFPTLGKDIEQINDFLEAVEGRLDGEEDEDEYKDEA